MDIFLLLYYFAIFYLVRGIFAFIKSIELIREEQFFLYLIENRNELDLSENIWNILIYFIEIENKGDWINEE